MRRILVLDDEVAVLAALRRALRAAFQGEAVEIETFDDPEAALLRAGEQDFDVVISDYRMPGLSGGDVLQMVKGLQPRAVRIVLSATTESADILDAVNRAEVFRFLAKPWEQDKLAATLRSAFARCEAQEEGAAKACPLRALEQEEPGITHVERDEHGNVRLY
jgi:two-component system, probable response regulator PhcQ